MADGIKVGACDWLGDMRNVVEPWEKNSRTYYRGRVRAVLADAIEPACCSVHLLLLMPDPESELGDCKCVAVNLGSGMGFSQLDFGELASSHDPATGLTLSFSHAIFDQELSRMGPTRRTSVRINLATNTVTAL